MDKQVEKTQIGMDDFLWSLALTPVAILAVLAFHAMTPTQAELLEQAKEAEQHYFMLRLGSVDHGRICKAAVDTYKLYEKAKDAERIELFAYIIWDDKCL